MSRLHGWSPAVRGRREDGGSETPFLTVKTIGFGAGAKVLPRADRVLPRADSGLARGSFSFDTTFGHLW